MRAAASRMRVRLFAYYAILFVGLYALSAGPGWLLPLELFPLLASALFTALALCFRAERPDLLRKTLHFTIAMALVYSVAVFVSLLLGQRFRWAMDPIAGTVILPLFFVMFAFGGIDVSSLVRSVVRGQPPRPVCDWERRGILVLGLLVLVGEISMLFIGATVRR